MKIKITKFHKIIGGLSRNLNSKYFVSSFENTDLIRVIKELKKVPPRDIDFQKSQLLEGKIKDKGVIIKIGDNNDIDNEYNISKSLGRTKGYVKFLHYFSCKDNFRDFFEGRKDKICDGEGLMKVIIMPHFQLGSMATYKLDVDSLRSSLYLACLFYIDAFQEKGFIHNDFHAGNILLKTTKQTKIDFGEGYIVQTNHIRPWICDFEKSVIGIDINNAKLYGDFKYDLQKLFFLLPTFIDNIEKSGCIKISSFIENCSNIKEIKEKLKDTIYSFIIIK